MKRLTVLLLLFLAAACDRSTPRLAAGTPEPTPTVVLSTAEPTSAPATHAPRTAVAMPDPPRDAQRARVLRVTDGDTIVLSQIGAGELDRSTGGRKARLIGVNTPEVFGGAECYGREASDFTKQTLDGKNVLVDFDVDAIDRYGRALVYVWETNGAFFNGRLVAEGYAYQSTFPPNVRYVDLFARLVTEARAHNRGLWAKEVC